jgi:hypothetical protein
MSAVQDLMGLGMNAALAQRIVNAELAQTVTSNTTIGTSYNGQVIPVNSGSGVTLTFGNLPAGFNCAVIQMGAGQVTFSGIVSQASFTKTAGQYAICGVLTPVAGTNILSGDGA